MITIEALHGTATPPPVRDDVMTAVRFYPAIADRFTGLICFVRSSLGMVLPLRLARRLPPPASTPSPPL